MEKELYTAEYELKASPKIIYPYLSTASGLAQWFADDVNITPEKDFLFYWDGEENSAKLKLHKTNHMVKFEFMNDEEDPDTITFEVEANEMTQTTFLTVKDYSALDGQEDFEELWDGHILALKELLGA